MATGYEVIKYIIDMSGNYSDVDVSATECIELHCEELKELAIKKYMKDQALAAGIPESVIDGKTKLTDHFSQEYIDMKCGKDTK